jgi:uncharacterized protein (DUF58 family)
MASSKINTEQSTEEKRRKLRRIEIKTRKLSNQIFSGSYHSAFKGRGMSFSEVREYQYGDDIRSIDWNVTARHDHPYVKVYEEERELTMMLLIDVSQSSFFGTQNEFKNHIIAEISGVLAFSAITNNDKVGVIFFSDIIEKFIPPKKGKTHILRIISEIYDFHPKNAGTNIEAALRYFNNVVKKKSIAFLLSDFINTGFKDALKIAGRRHDLIGVRVYDERESLLPDMGLTKVMDAESKQEIWIDTSEKKVRDNYAKWFNTNAVQLKELFGRSGSELVSIRTDESYIIALMNMFSQRGKRR